MVESIRCDLMAEVSGVRIGQVCDCQARHMEVELTWSSMDIEAKGAGEGNRVQALGSAPRITGNGRKAEANGAESPEQAPKCCD